jgi:hypothetical protein
MLQAVSRDPLGGAKTQGRPALRGHAESIVLKSLVFKVRKRGLKSAEFGLRDVKRGGHTADHRSPGTRREG